MKIKIGILLLGATTLFNSCENKSELKSGISKENMNLKVKPGDNFEEYVNGTWLKNNKIPADKSSYGVFDMLIDKSQKDVKEIIEEATKQNAAEGTDEQKIGDFFASYMDMKKRNELGVKPLKPWFDKIDQIKSYSDLAAYFGDANKTGVSTPMVFYVTEDLKDPTKYVVSSWQSGLGLLEREFYMNKDRKSVELLKKYCVHIEKMLVLASIPYAKEKAKTVLSLEKQIAAIQMSNEETRDELKLYNKFEVSQLKTLMHDFDWKNYFRSAGFKNLKSVVISQIEYTKKLNSIIINTPLETWRIYLKWSVINDLSRYLNEDMVNEKFNFFGKVIAGVEKPQSIWKKAVQSVDDNLGEIVGKMYVKKHFKPKAKQRMEELVSNIIKAYENSIKDLDWMSSKTKKEALKKLKKINVKIGYPKKWKDYSKLIIKKDDYLGNVLRSFEFEYKIMLGKLRKSVDRDEWEMTPQEVNAYYNSSLNEIVFPAAILQKPFFNLDADDAVNYGAIGALIGHEIGHGFDDIGATIDGDGVMRNWWTDSDLKAFKQRTGALVEQYNSYKVLPDLKINGWNTLGENIGDLCGLSMAVKAYKLSLNSKEPITIDGLTGLQRLFIGYGQSRLEKSREELLRIQIAVDEHAPEKFRINGVVRNVPEFYDAFDIQKNDSLYLAPEKRVKIW